MDIDQHVRELLKAMSDGVYEKEHIIAMTLLSASNANNCANGHGKLTPMPLILKVPIT